METKDQSAESNAEVRVEKSSRGGRFFRNTAYTATASIFAQVLAILTLPLLLNRVGPAEFGIYALAAASFGYLSLLSMPARNAVMKFLAEPKWRATDQAAGLFSSAMILNLATGLLIGVVLLSLAVNANRLFEVEAQSLERMELVLIVYGVAAVFIHPLSVFGSIHYGLQVFGPVAVLDALEALVRAATVLCIYFFGGTILWLAGAEIGSQVVKGLILAARARRIFPYFRMEFSRIQGDILKRMLLYGGWSVLYTLALMIVYQGNRILVGVILSVSAVAYYHVATVFYNVINTISGLVITAVIPASSEALSSNDSRFISKLTRMGTRAVVSVLLPVCANLILFMEPIVRVWLGQEFVNETVGVSRMLLASWIIALPGFFLVNVYRGQRDIAPVSLAAFLMALVEIALVVLLGRSFGLVGVSMAVVIFFTLLAPMQLLISSRKLSIGVVKFLRESALSLYCITAAYIALIFGATSFLGMPESIAAVLVIFSTSCFVNIVLCFALGAKEESKYMYRSMVRALGRQAYN